MENKVDVITSMGYKKESYGYKRVTDNNTHWITLFDDVLQMSVQFRGSRGQAKRCRLIK
jgi:hypothetical protein